MDAAIAFQADPTAEHGDAEQDHPAAGQGQEVDNDSEGDARVQEGDSEADADAAPAGLGPDAAA